MVSAATIRLIDSTQASMGTGWLAILAARAALLGQARDQIVTMLLDTIPRLRLVAVIDDLHFMYRSGRVSWAQALLGSFLHIKPVVMLKSGRVDLLEKVRTRAKAIERLVAITAGLGPLQEVAVLHANALKDAETAADTLAARLTSARAVFAEAGVTMTTHAGPRAVAFACVLGKS